MLDDALFLVRIGVAIGVAGYVVWISVQSLMQARVLWQATRVGTSGLSSDRPAALYGQVRVLGALRKPQSRSAKRFTSNCLWWRVKDQKYNRGWKTVHEEIGTARFVLGAGARLQ